MKWMFKEDHSLGKRSAIGPAVGAGAAGGPPPPLGPPWVGPGGADAALWSRVAEVPAPRAAAHPPRADLCGTFRSQWTGDRGCRDA